MTYYRIRDWAKHFENNRTKEMVKMSWVPVPNKHDGEGFQRIMREPDGIVIYGCWHLILQVASKCLRDRGTLLREDGTPLTAESIALKTGWRRPEDFQRALDFLCSSEMSWMERLTDGVEEIPHLPAGIPHLPARNGMEWNGTEEKGSTPPSSPKGAVVLPFDSENFRTAWSAWKEHRRRIRKPMTGRAEELTLAKLPKTESEAIRWIDNAIERGWQGIYEPKNELQPAPTGTRTPVPPVRPTCGRSVFSDNIR